MPSVIRRAPKLTDLDQLAEMVRQGASIAECDRLRPDLTSVQRRALEALRPVPRAEQLAAAGDGGRPWGSKEDAVLRTKIPARTADQIRVSALPWRPAIQIRARAAELGLSWGDGELLAAPSARARGAGPTRLAAVAPVVVPQNVPASAPAAAPLVWTAAQDSLLALQAGTVPFLVLRERLAAVGPTWARQDIRHRMTQLTEARRIRPGRGLALRAFEKEVAVRVDKLCAKGRAPEQIASEIGRGYTANMVRRLQPNLTFAPARRGRKFPEPIRQPVLVYPMTREAVLEELTACCMSVAEWSRRNGYSDGAVRSALNGSGRRRNTPLTRALGLFPELGTQPVFVYPMTPQGIRKELKACKMSIAQWSKRNGFDKYYVRDYLKRKHSRHFSTQLSRALGLAPARGEVTHEAPAVTLVYPLTVEGVKAAFKSANITPAKWAYANGFTYNAVLRMLKSGPGRYQTRLSRALGLSPPR